MKGENDMEMEELMKKLLKAQVIANEISIINAALSNGWIENEVYKAKLVNLSKSNQELAREIG